MVVELGAGQLHERHQEEHEGQVAHMGSVHTLLVHVGHEEDDADRSHHEQRVGQVHGAPPGPPLSHRSKDQSARQEAGARHHDLGDARLHPGAAWEREIGQHRGRGGGTEEQARAESCTWTDGGVAHMGSMMPARGIGLHHPGGCHSGPDGLARRGDAAPAGLCARAATRSAGGAGLRPPPRCGPRHPASRRCAQGGSSPCRGRCRGVRRCRDWCGRRRGAAAPRSRVR